MKRKKNNIYIYLFIAIFIAFLLVVLSLYTKQFDHFIINRDIHNHNITFNEFARNLKGNEIVSLINFTDDFNNKSENRNNNVEIEIKVTDDKIISKDAILKLGIERFLENFADQNFKFLEKEFYENGKISLFRYELLNINSLNNEEEILNIY